ncbi:MAG: 50S ribosomal protein L16, partial [Candidatus Aenigmarchaeota archaeon]|nr:50S ribosomal protein L16 [Candidatus Aenigmarchaeota archaeon]
MATLRPGRCYNKFANKPFTRYSKRRPKKSFVKGVPVSKIHHFDLGNRTGVFSNQYHITPKRDVQIRSNAMEAARMACQKYLATHIGDKGFRLKIRVHPHHVLRQNSIATGAGADRFSQGMRRAFGKPTGQAARVKKDQKVFTVFTNGNSYKIVKEA